MMDLILFLAFLVCVALCRPAPDVIVDPDDPPIFDDRQDRRR
jgi:hypothetical protein